MCLQQKWPYQGIISTYAYDRNGNRLSEDVNGALTSYAWDEENRLTGIVYPTAQIETYAYAGDGQRRSKQTSSGTTLFVWDGQNLLQETNSSLALEAHYTDFPGVWGGLISMRRRRAAFTQQSSRKARSRCSTSMQT